MSDSLFHLSTLECTESFSDEVKLINIRLPRPEWIPVQQLCKNAAQGPHIHRRAVLGVSHQQLGSSVPASRYVVGVIILRPC